MAEEKKKNKGGRPARFKSAGELGKKVAEYINDCPDKREIVTGDIVTKVPCPTVSGLAYFLGFESRQSMYDYGEKDEFSYIIGRAKLWIEMNYEQKLSGKYSTGAQFALQNMGWSEKKEVTLEATATVKHEDLNERIAAIATDDEGE